jgi:nucleotide-binding universal stress UspA family protein
MKKIVVTTDLSKASKAGLKFAIQLASQYEVKLVFLQVIELLIPTRWNDVKAKLHMDEEIRLETEKLQDFVLQIYKTCKKRPGKFDCVVRYGAPVSEAILDYANEIGANFICMATRGAGKFSRLMGTHTSAVIRKSHIPILAIPKSYKASAIKEILYASDLSSLKRELRTVEGFAKKIDSSVSVVHFESRMNSESKESFKKMVNKHGLTSVKFKLEKANSEKPLSWHLRKTARKFRADLVAMFAHDKEPWLVRFFQGSKTVEASFDSVKPLLVFPK